MIELAQDDLPEDKSGRKFTRPMSIAEVSDLQHYIQQNNRFCQGNPARRSVKYVVFSYDTREGCVHSVTFRGGFAETSIHCSNEARFAKKSLFDRCIAWLDEDVTPKPASVKEGNPTAVWPFPIPLDPSTSDPHP